MCTAVAIRELVTAEPESSVMFDKPKNVPIIGCGTRESHKPPESIGVPGEAMGMDTEKTLRIDQRLFPVVIVPEDHPRRDVGTPSDT
jgi:hypothetical protein